MTAEEFQRNKEDISRLWLIGVIEFEKAMMYIERCSMIRYSAFLKEQKERELQCQQKASSAND